jgi:hypothetical protein
MRTPSPVAILIQAGGFKIEEESEAGRLIREGREELDKRTDRWKEDEGESQAG